MKVFTCTSFGGHYPVGTAAVIVARDRGHARRLLRKALKECGLEEDNEIFVEVDVETAGAIVLRDGEY